jgi:hypothetical protein
VNTKEERLIVPYKTIFIGTEENKKATEKHSSLRFIQTEML